MLYIGLPRSPSRLRVRPSPFFDRLRNGIRRCNFGIWLIALKAASGHLPLTLYVGLPRSPSRLRVRPSPYFDRLRNGIRRCNFGIWLIALKAAFGHLPLTLYVGLPRSPSRLRVSVRPPILTDLELEFGDVTLGYG